MRDSCMHPLRMSASAHLLGGEDVCALDVPVHHALLVQVLQARQHLGDVHGHERLREHAELVGFDDAGQRAVVHVLQDDVQMRAGLEGANVLDNVLVIQGFEQLDLPHHAVQAVGGDAPHQGDLLDRHGVTVGQVQALVDLAVCTTPELLEEGEEEG